MPKRHSLSKWFGGGRHHVLRFCESNTLLFKRDGKANGCAAYHPNSRVFVRDGVSHKSLAALLRAVETEGAESFSQKSG